MRPPSLCAFPCAHLSIGPPSSPHACIMCLYMHSHTKLHMALLLAHQDNDLPSGATHTFHARQDFCHFNACDSLVCVWQVECKLAIPREQQIKEWNKEDGQFLHPVPFVKSSTHQSERTGSVRVADHRDILLFHTHCGSLTRATQQTCLR